MDSLKSVDWRGIYKNAKNKVKQLSLNLTDLEVKVEDATSNETWGPHGSVMTEIADAAFDPENYRQIMGVIARRLQERDENWRMAYKALLLLEFLIKQGPTKVYADVVSSSTVLDRLQNFQYKDANGKDLGTNVRHRAKEIAELVGNPDRVKEERDKAKSNRAKYTGVSASQMRSGASGFGSASSGASAASRGGGADRGASRDGGRSSFGGGAVGAGAGLGAGGSGSGSLRGSEGREPHYISRSPSSAAPLPAAGRGFSGEEGGDDAAAATRARIERLKLGGRLGGEERLDAAAAAGASKKRLTLTDVKVNPKIAASLGLPVAAPRPSAPAPGAAAAAAAPAASGPDLLGDLLGEETPAGSNGTVSGGGGGWDAFGEGAHAVPAAPAAAPAPLAGLADLLPAAPVQQQAAFDPFATAGPSAPSTFPAAFPAAAAAVDPFALPAAAAPAPAAVVPAAAPPPPAAMGVRKSQPLPEDMFADLTGMSRPLQPMGQPSGLTKQPAPLATPAPGLGAPAAVNFAAFGGVSPPAAAPAPPPATAPGKDPFAGLL